VACVPLRFGDMLEVRVRAEVPRKGDAVGKGFGKRGYRLIGLVTRQREEKPVRERGREYFELFSFCFDGAK
jgi:hypothetical protein